jgi:melanoma-associated antigen p97
VAFVRHTTARENLDGRNVAFWSRNRRSFDYQLLCNDGTRADIDSWASCNMGEVPSNAIVTSGKTHIYIYICFEHKY